MEKLYKADAGAHAHAYVHAQLSSAYHRLELYNADTHIRRKTHVHRPRIQKIMAKYIEKI